MDGRIGLVVTSNSGMPQIKVYRLWGLIHVETSGSGAALTAEQARAVRRMLSRYIREIESGEAPPPPEGER